MQIIIHRGTHQIGGCVTEIRTAASRILIDMGSELPDESGHAPPERLSIPGVTHGPAQCDGIFVTHYHGDHAGSLSLALPGIPVYMGAAAREILLAFYKRRHQPPPRSPDGILTIAAGTPINAGDIRVTPVLTDHSAYDAYMFVVEAEGKKILHTGDFRLHGFRSKAVLPTLAKHVGQVDVLITEGTTFSREAPTYETERDLQLRARKLLREWPYVFVLCASTHLDRIAAFHEATPAGKYFFCDGYQKGVLEIGRRYGAKYTALYNYSKALVYGDNLRDKALERGFVMLVRATPSFMPLLEEFRTGHPEKCLLVYSMWEGYLRQPGSQLQNLMQSFAHTQCLHVSGHASPPDIASVCQAVAPRRAILPIHTVSPAGIHALGLPFPVVSLRDGQLFDV